MTRPLLLIAGTSESGKSTAGAHLAARGAHRVKIRTILTQLVSGIPAVHEGVPMREGFDHAEFVDRVLDLPIPPGRIAIVIESFIDVALAQATRRAWPAPCRIVFITAARPTRLHRLATGQQISHEQAAALLDAKDARKRVNQQLDRWHAAADAWVDNAASRAEYLARLDQILTELTAHHHEGRR